MVLVPGDAGLLAAPLAAAGGLSKGVQQEKQDILRKLPPMPWNFKPSGMGLPSPEDIVNEVEGKVRDFIQFPLKVIEGGMLPAPHQALREVRTRKPFEEVGQHIKTVPTPRRLIKTIPPFSDLPTPVDVVNDIERAIEDLHTIFADGHNTVIEQVPVGIENTKMLHADATALRHSGVELAQASAKSMLRVSRSLQKLLNDFADNGILGLIF